MLGTVLLAAFGLSLGVVGAPVDQKNSSQLPVVDLGYEIHQALLYNDSSNYYKFQNIRYAEAPVGNLRFRAPRSPLVNRSQVQNGSENRFCPQGAPAFLEKAFGPIGRFSANNPNDPFTLAKWEQAIANATLLGIPWGKGTTEDCLFLDVWTQPRNLPSTQNTTKRAGKGAPVLIWIHGGGNVEGSKTGFPSPSFDPNTLLSYGQADSDSGMVYVALNYRLGALGFLAGSEVAKDGDLNAALLDQRFALQWVQKNIHLFGGDPDRVTVMGESGGAGYVTFQSLAYGGRRGAPPFKQAIIQSPATHTITLEQAEPVYSGFMSALNVKSLAEARKLPSQAVIDANTKFIGSQPNVSFGFWSVVDGSFLPASAPELFRTGRYYKSLKTLSAINAFEGGFFFDPNVKTEDDFKRMFQTTFSVTNKTLADYVANSVYPPIFDGSLGYVDQDTRQIVMNGEGLFTCSEELITKYYGNGGYSYQFSVPPAFHTQDTRYTFKDPSPVPFPAAQESLQRAIASFAAKGVPTVYDRGSSPFPFPTWNPNTRQVVNITSTGLSLGKRAVNQTRCDFWLGDPWN